LLNERIKRYGTNVPKPVEVKSFCRLIQEQLGDPILRILIAAAGVALILGITKEGMSTVNFS